MYLNPHSSFPNVETKVSKTKGLHHGIKISQLVRSRLELKLRACVLCNQLILLYFL